MKIKNISATHLDGKPIKEGSVHEVEAHIARNLIRDGRAVAHDEAAERLDLQRPEGEPEIVVEEAPAKKKRRRRS